MSTDESESSLSFSLEDLPFDRFNEFLEELAAKGVSQQEVANRLGVSAQYVTDIKARRRRVSELFARRLEDQFHRSRGWFLGTEDDPNGTLAPQGVEGHAARAHLPVFPHPIAGDPFTHPDWDGAEIEVCGVAAIKALAGRWSYLLRFGVNDRQQRIGRNDLILISQAAKDDAAIQVLESMNKCFLARRKAPGGWEPLSPHRHSVGEPTIVGHAVGIVWAAL